MRLGRSRIAQDELHDAGELLDLQKGMAQAEFGDRTPGRVDHPAGCRIAAAEGLQHSLAPRRRRFDRRRVGRDPKQPHHVKAPPARAWNRVRAPQRRKRRAGQHRVDPAVITRTPRRRESVVQGDFAVADSPEAGEAGGTDGMRLGFACGIVEFGQFVAAAPNAISASSNRSGWINTDSWPSKHVAHADSRPESTVACCNWETAPAAEATSPAASRASQRATSSSAAWSSRSGSSSSISSNACRAWS